MDWPEYLGQPGREPVARLWSWLLERIPDLALPYCVTDGRGVYDEFDWALQWGSAWGQSNFCCEITPEGDYSWFAWDGPGKYDGSEDNVRELPPTAINRLLAVNRGIARGLPSIPGPEAAR